MGADEQVWVDGLRRGEVSAFDAVYHAYRDRLRGFLAAMCGRADIADELLQETFIRLARSSPNLRPDTRLGAWLFTVARNLATSHNRWRWLDASRLLELGRGSGHADPHRALEARDLTGRIDEALSRLPAPQREAFLLVVVEGLAPADAALIAQCKPEALRQRLSRARAALAEAVGEGAA